jgi:hypothetical protein
MRILSKIAVPTTTEKSMTPDWTAYHFDARAVLALSRFQHTPHV